MPKGLLLRGLVALVLLSSIFLLQADLSETLELVRRADWRYLLAGIAVAVAGELLTALKLKWLYEGVGRSVPYGPVTRSCFIAMFYNNVLPGSVGGDIARVFLLARYAGGKAIAAAGVFMQRNTGMGGLLIVALLASSFPPFRLGRFSGAVWWLDYAAFWFALVAAAYVAVNLILVSNSLYRFVWARVLDRGTLASSGETLSQQDGSSGLHFRGKLESIGSKLHRLHEALRLFRTGWGMALLISVMTQLVDCLLVWLAGRALGLQLSFQFLCICVPAVILAALLPVSVNGIGLREWVYKFFLGLIGVSAEAAVALSLLHFATHLLLSLGGGIMQWVGAGGETEGTGMSRFTGGMSEPDGFVEAESRRHGH